MKISNHRKKHWWKRLTKYGKLFSVGLGKPKDCMLIYSPTVIMFVNMLWKNLMYKSHPFHCRFVMWIQLKPLHCSYHCHGILHPNHDQGLTSIWIHRCHCRQEEKAFCRLPLSRTPLPSLFSLTTVFIILSLPSLYFFLCSLCVVCQDH